jgi:hypothetical protein
MMKLDDPDTDPLRKPLPREVKAWVRLHPTWASIYYGRLMWAEYDILDEWIRFNLPRSDWRDFHEGVHLLFFRNEEDLLAIKLRFKI